MQHIPELMAKGRDKKLIELRDEALCRRYYYWTEVQRLRFADALIKAGKNFDMVLLPGAKHGYTGANERFYEKKLWNHFARYLLNDAEAGNCVDLKDLK